MFPYFKLNLIIWLKDYHRIKKTKKQKTRCRTGVVVSSQLVSQIQTLKIPFTLETDRWDGKYLEIYEIYWEMSIVVVVGILKYSIFHRPATAPTGYRFYFSLYFEKLIFRIPTIPCGSHFLFHFVRLIFHRLTIPITDCIFRFSCKNSFFTNLPSRSSRSPIDFIFVSIRKINYS